MCLLRITCWIIKVRDTPLRICNTYCFCTATMFTRTCLSVNVYTCSACLVKDIGGLLRINSLNVLLIRRQQVLNNLMKMNKS
jgi:hypothetical protein